MDARWPRLPQPTVAWSSADDDDLDRAGFVVNGTEASLEWHELRELDDATSDGLWRDDRDGVDPLRKTSGERRVTSRN